MDIVSLDQAKTHLKLDLTATHADDDVTLKLALAHGFVAGYVDNRDDAAWTAEVAAWDEDTAPPQVVAAVLMQLSELWRFRGDTLDGEAPLREPGMPHPQIVSMLAKLRDPGIA